MAYLPNSEQLELWPAMFPGERSLPWGGVSPRVLTAGYKRFILKTQGEKSASVDPLQHDLWKDMVIQKAPRIYRGAPLLVEPRRRVH